MHGSNRILLHNEVAKKLCAFASAGLLNAQQEPRPFPSSPGSRLDVGFFHNGKHILVDVAVTHALRSVHVDHAAAAPGGACDEYAKVKFATYGHLLLQNQVLKPFVVDTFGAFGTDAQELLRLIGSAFCQRTNSGQLGKHEVATVINSIVMRGVAGLLLSTTTPSA